MPPYYDPDPQETEEWRDAFVALMQAHGAERGRQMLSTLGSLLQGEMQGQAVAPAAPAPAPAATGYVNTITPAAQAPFPGDLATEEHLASLMRWNALAMVIKANQAYGELGGHIASYASAADLFEVGFNHFFRGRAGMAPEQRGDLVFFQPHSAPGIYARAYLEGRLTEQDLLHFRREIAAGAVGAKGLSSYPHPYLMPDFWQFPTGSMGIGPINSIYQARFMHYLADRGILDCQGRRVWGVFGDGEMDEPESMAALTLAAREGLDNLTWVVNCNLQRLDGPVRGNGKIIDELERLFTGAGWNVIKLLWGSDWDPLFERDTTGALRAALAQTVDGQMQTLAAKDADFNRLNFFGQNAEIADIVASLSDEQIDALKRGGHDIRKIHAAYHAAAAARGAPTVILAHTKKGYGMGPAVQGKMTTHSNKKFEPEDLLAFRDRFKLPLTDEQVRDLTFFRPAEDSPEMQYLRARRDRLGGSLPRRHTECAPLAVPALGTWGTFATDANGKEMSTTMAFVRMLGSLLKDPEAGPRLVPIVADEARTFGMANLFKQVGIYARHGQRYEPEDIGSLLAYREATDGQILEEGISEAGAISSWTAAATSYSTHGVAMLPFYIYYSMFGFQRIGDLIWAAADQRPRGFLIGATSGRTTLGGEGLQHQDGTSHLWASTIPNCKAYDPAHAGELAVIIEQGMQEMLQDQRDVFYYVTVMNENYAQPTLARENHAAVLRGGYLFETKQGQPGKPAVTLLGSGAIFREALQAAEILHGEGHTVYVYSITSWTELARDAQACEESHLRHMLQASAGPIVAASDYVRLLPESLRAHLPADRSYRTLGTDGFGRSDTRAALRGHFGVDATAIASAAREGRERG
ncbi:MULTISPECIES: pyruvate dehydrogenase (acetyl-transferring), homodimeric type [unclassified Achromobacter]|uniref:pyruvate dehydrogenase (acetyl-transferring), homodimeric type n=1 Tax=unclassified Achromobacter TaxID=2626865 RepID=UPI000B51C9D3|nr:MULTISPECIES: pyruvate dehydrogenase (acetyl-transferring), homodimeric type [unclassified Achromobacter]OWT71449.1 pyruvate dehydrogenase (acetyl-transferring), homodimeric type [Achromobacter sp. HZ34]OWT73106.1 pyruvate dehydrogenase (acetyl-transferring), homodimeric type [Achromobacter sp. HZ28]